MRDRFSQWLVKWLDEVELDCLLEAMKIKRGERPKCKADQIVVFVCLFLNWPDYNQIEFFRWTQDYVHGG